MEHLLEVTIRQTINDDNTVGLLYVDKETSDDTELDAVLIRIVKTPEHDTLLHYNNATKSVEYRIVELERISRILVNGQDRRLVEWLINGKIVSEKEESISTLRKEILDKNKRYKIAVEFSRLVRKYTEAKRLFDKGHFLDAFNSILYSLHHLARISVIEHGIYPEVTVWQQVKKLEPEIYKLYDEMVTGEESIEKRIDLLLIALHFAITSKTKTGSSHLIEVMKESDRPWSIEALSGHHSLKEYGDDLVVLLEYLVQKGIIDFVKYETELEGVYFRHYYIK
ncbi:nucleotidyltransferase-like protein [Anaerobacillus alkaliphilus]|uniref:nucleotidyltransferase-like protein n=1 Tax=Anaerobacillus alkaliphilus TaxID=1548597 RepID=UPI0013755457|nr:nucleotidyltransferase-like protein [Anaerobacillus alkaliphilus]